MPTIDWYQRQGRITKRTERPTLERASVEEFAVWWRQRQEGRQRARKRTRPEPNPAEWATAKEAAELLGVSAGHLGYLSRRGQLVDLVEGGRRWIRRDSLRAVMAERGEWVSYTTDNGALSGVTVTAVAAHTMALGFNGKVYTWGYNLNGQLGNGTTTESTTPVAVTDTDVLSGIKVIANEAGNSHTVALGSNGTVYTWGNNTDGQLGDASTTRRTAPVAVAAP